MGRNARVSSITHGSMKHAPHNSLSQVDKLDVTFWLEINDGADS